ncbi:MAG TPA: SDR family oxidoreductase [Candidatus Limnocylindrales bacterium]
MDRVLQGTVAVVTGASSGIGRATALELARRGASVVVAARRDEPLASLVEECRQAGGDALGLVADVTDEAAVELLARSAVERFGRLDVWVNNAGVTIFGTLEETPMESIRRMFDVNVFGYLNGARAALRIFREQGRGTIINNASMMGKVAAPYQAHYAMTKAAIVALGEGLREELMDDPGIDVCTVMPASIDTPFFEHAANYAGRAPQPPGPVYSAEEVARTIADCVTSPRREAFVGGVGRMASVVRRVSPAAWETMAARQIPRETFADAPAPRSDGNLFQPLASGTGVSGGWDADAAATNVARYVGAGVGVAAVIGAGMWLRTRR